MRTGTLRAAAEHLAAIATLPAVFEEGVYLLIVNVYPAPTPEEVLDILIHLCRGLLWVTITANELVGFTSKSDLLRTLADELDGIASSAHGPSPTGNEADRHAAVTGLCAACICDLVWPVGISSIKPPAP